MPRYKQRVAANKLRLVGGQEGKPPGYVVGDCALAARMPRINALAAFFHVDIRSGLSSGDRVILERVAVTRPMTHHHLITARIAERCLEIARAHGIDTYAVWDERVGDVLRKRDDAGLRRPV